MSEVLEAAANKLREHLGEFESQSTARIEIEGEGVIMITPDGVSIGDGVANVSVIGDLEVFQEMFDGELSPATAFMSGRVRIEGDMGVAMQLVQLFG